jgi:RNA polymerase sigma factor (sigma-70 family)
VKQNEAYYKTLWQQFRGGDKEALGEIYNDFVGVLYNYGYHIYPDPFVVQDAIQDLFVDLWRLRETISEAQSVKFYLFSSLRRRLIRASKDSQNTLSLEENYGLTTNLQETEAFDEAAYAQQIRTLQKHITTLPPRQIEALRLRFFDNFSLEQIADIMQMNEQSVRNSISRAILKLRYLFT